MRFPELTFRKELDLTPNQVLGAVGVRVGHDDGRRVPMRRRS